MKSLRTLIGIKPEILRLVLMSSEELLEEAVKMYIKDPTPKALIGLRMLLDSRDVRRNMPSATSVLDADIRNLIASGRKTPKEKQ